MITNGLDKKKVIVAIIDSGLSSSLKINAGIKYTCNLSEETSIEDSHGHGTALMGMIDEFCDNSIEFIICKVLNNKCGCSSRTLLSALEHVIDLRPDIINLSLGSEDMSLREEYTAISNRAFSKDIILVTTTGSQSMSLPYMTEGVVRIIANNLITDFQKLYIDRNFLFHAIGIPHIVPWKNGEYVFINRNSFVTPYFIREFVRYKNSYSLSNYSILEKMMNDYADISSIESNEIEYELPGDSDLFLILSDIFKKFVPKLRTEYNAFSQGLTMNNCVSVLMDTQKVVDKNIPFTFFNINDFAYVSNFSNKVKKLLS